MSKPLGIVERLRDCRYEPPPRKELADLIEALVEALENVGRWCDERYSVGSSEACERIERITVAALDRAGTQQGMEE